MYSLPNIVQVIKAIRMKWAGQACSAWSRIRDVVGKSEGKDHLGDPVVDGRITLLWNFRKWDVEVWTGLSWQRKGTGGGHL